MRILGLGLSALAVFATGCLSPSAKQRLEDNRQARLLSSRPAMYSLANARRFNADADELEREVREQELLVRQLKIRTQQVFGEAGRARANMRVAKTVREATALNLEGEGRRIRSEVAGRMRLIDILKNRAGWSRRQAHGQAHRIGQIMHGEIPTR